MKTKLEKITFTKRQAQDLLWILSVGENQLNKRESNLCKKYKPMLLEKLEII